MTSNIFETTRRNFLKIVTTGMGVTLMPSILQSEDEKSSNPDNKMKLGIGNVTRYGLDPVA